MRLPTFLIIGAAKCGTTALTRFLQAHPQVHIPFKEPNFFSGWETRVKFYEPLPSREPPLPYCGTRDEYEALFAQAGSARAVGEASVSYLPDEGSAARIRETLPAVKLIAFFRQPVERAFSQFVMRLRMGLEPERDFRRIMLNEGERVRKGWHPFLCYGSIGRYAPQLARYQALFSPEQLRAYLYEDWNDAPQHVWSDLTAFIDVDPSFEPDFRERPNAAWLPRRGHRAAQSAARVVKPWLRPLFPQGARRQLGGVLDRMLWYRPSLAPEVRSELTHTLFREDILRLQDMLRRDLSSWLR